MCLITAGTFAATWAERRIKPQHIQNIYRSGIRHVPHATQTWLVRIQWTKKLMITMKNAEIRRRSSSSACLCRSGRETHWLHCITFENSSLRGRCRSSKGFIFHALFRNMHECQKLSPPQSDSQSDFLFYFIFWNQVILTCGCSTGPPGERVLIKNTWFFPSLFTFCFSKPLNYDGPCLRFAFRRQ